MNTTALSITDFLLARIAEDEATARQVIETPDRERFCENLQWMGDEWRVVAHGGVVASTTARILAECEAKRRLMEEHWSVIDDGQAVCFEEQAAWPCPTVRAIANVYEGHPDFRDEWAFPIRPTGDAIGTTSFLYVDPDGTTHDLTCRVVDER